MNCEPHIKDSASRGSCIQFLVVSGQLSLLCVVLKRIFWSLSASLESYFTRF